MYFTVKFHSSSSTGDEVRYLTEHDVVITTVTGTKVLR